MFYTIMQLKVNVDTNEERYFPICTSKDDQEAGDTWERLELEGDAQHIIIIHPEIDDLRPICGPGVWAGLTVPDDEEVPSGDGNREDPDATCH